MFVLQHGWSVVTIGTIPTDSKQQDSNQQTQYENKNNRIPLDLFVYKVKPQLGHSDMAYEITNDSGSI